MKTKIVLIITLLCGIIQFAYSQPDAYYLLKLTRPGPPSSHVVEHYAGGTYNIGIGVQEPIARLEVSSYPSTLPYAIMASSGNTAVHAYLTQSQAVGFFQTHLHNQNVENCFNLFEDPLIIGGDPHTLDYLYVLDINGGFKLNGNIHFESSEYGTRSILFEKNNQGQGNLDFGFFSPESTIFRLNGTGATVFGKLSTQSFLLSENAGLGKALISDSYGNGIWTDISNYNDNDWIRTQYNDLYSNCRNVGIGTMYPRTGKLEIAENEEDDSKYALILNQKFDKQRAIEMRFDFLDQEKWAIGQFYIDDNPQKNSFFIWNQERMNCPLIIEGSTGNIGIETLNPRSRLEIVNQTENRHSLILNRILEEGKPHANEIQFQINSEEKWAIGSWLSDQNSFFIWNHEREAAEFYIAANGMTGINTTWPNATLDVNGSMKAWCIGIGTDAPATNSPWKLFVLGGIKAREIKVTIQSFADYVFSDNYFLLSIPEYAKFINKNKHLPGMPTAAEVEKNDGVELGSMQNKLLEKVEEQALYIIELQKQIDELKQTVNSLKEKRP